MAFAPRPARPLALSTPCVTLASRPKGAPMASTHSPTRAVSLSLPSGATLSHVYAALGATLPMLLGRVISPEGERLSPGYACNLNGLDFVRTATATINSGDTIFILSADAGG